MGEFRLHHLLSVLRRTPAPAKQSRRLLLPTTKHQDAIIGLTSSAPPTLTTIRFDQYNVIPQIWHGQRALQICGGRTQRFSRLRSTRLLLISFALFSRTRFLTCTTAFTSIFLLAVTGAVVHGELVTVHVRGARPPPGWCSTSGNSCPSTIMEETLTTSVSLVTLPPPVSIAAPTPAIIIMTISEPPEPIATPSLSPDASPSASPEPSLCTGVSHVLQKATISLC